jgi:DHA1 family bicyclomycin/chloramphenicol resistance-like MFS transporter
MAFASPLVGGILTPILGWRWAVAAMAVFGAGTWLLVSARFKESLASPNLQALQWTHLLHNWLTIVRNPVFQVWSALVVASYAGLFTYLAAASFVFATVYGMPRVWIGLAMASCSVSYIAGTFLCRRLLARHGLQGAVQRGAFITLAGGSAMGLLAWAGLHTWWAFLLPMHLFMLGHGIHQPCGQTGAVSPFPQMAGTASALSGFFLTVVAFAIGAWLGWRIDGTVFPLVNGVWLWSTVIAVLAWTVVQSHGSVAAPAVVVVAS